MKAPSQGKSNEPAHRTVFCSMARLPVLLVGFPSVVLAIMSPFSALFMLVPSVLLIVGWWRHWAASIGFLWLGLCCLGFALWDHMWSHGFVIGGVPLFACAVISFLAWWIEEYGESDVPHA